MNPWILPVVLMVCGITACDLSIGGTGPQGTDAEAQPDATPDTAGTATLGEDTLQPGRAADAQDGWGDGTQGPTRGPSLRDAGATAWDVRPFVPNDGGPGGGERDVTQAPESSVVDAETSDAIPTLADAGSAVDISDAHAPGEDDSASGTVSDAQDTTSADSSLVDDGAGDASAAEADAPDGLSEDASDDVEGAAPAPGTMGAPCKYWSQCKEPLICTEAGVCDILFKQCIYSKSCGAGSCVEKLGGLDGTCIETMGCFYWACAQQDDTCPGMGSCGCSEYYCADWMPPYPVECGQCVEGLGSRPEGAPCAIDEDCSPGLICRHVVVWTCAPPGGPGAPCELPHDCDDLVCVDGACTLPLPDGTPCAKSEQCMSGSVCGAASSGPVCVPSTGGVDEPCAVDAEGDGCAEALGCVDGTCHALVGIECQSVPKCGPGTYCANVEEKTSSAQKMICTFEQTDYIILCDGSSPSPWPYCTNIDWTIGSVGYCEKDAGTQLEGGWCYLDKTCAPGLSCNHHACLPPAADGASCDSDPDCGTGLLCDTAYSFGELEASGLCVAGLPEGEPCTVDANCGPGLHCNAGELPATCLPVGGEGAPCSEDAQCKNGLFCVNNHLFYPVHECRAKAKEYDSCKSDDQCADGLVCDPVHRLCCGPCTEWWL